MTTEGKPYLAAALLAALCVYAGCSAADNPPDTFEEVAEAPLAVAGQTITVEGRVARVLGDCAYLMEDGDLIGRDRMLTLCDPTPRSEPPPEAPSAVAEGDWLRITGVPGEMTREEYEYKTTLTLSEDLFDRTETRPVIFVRSATLIDEPQPPADGEARLPEGPVIVPIL